jgi:hypothetical protein
MCPFSILQSVSLAALASDVVAKSAYVEMNHALVQSVPSCSQSLLPPGVRGSSRREETVFRTSIMSSIVSFREPQFHGNEVNCRWLWFKEGRDGFNEKGMSRQRPCGAGLSYQGMLNCRLARLARLGIQP